MLIDLAHQAAIDFSEFRSTIAVRLSLGTPFDSDPLFGVFVGLCNGLDLEKRAKSLPRFLVEEDTFDYFLDREERRATGSDLLNHRYFIVRPEDTLDFTHILTEPITLMETEDGWEVFFRGITYALPEYRPGYLSRRGANGEAPTMWDRLDDL